jgi:hypothetical protein
MITVSPRLRRQENELERLLEQGGRPDDPSLSPLLALATSLRPGPLAPDAEFRAGLRAVLLAELADRAAERPAAPVRAGRDGSGRVEPAAGPRRTRRWRKVVAGVALTAVVAGTGSAIAATRALPGDPLYGLKLGIEKAQLSLAHGDVGKGRELLEQADHRLSEVEAMASGEDAGTAATDARISTALAAMDADVRQATDLLTRAYRDTGDPEPMRILSRFLTDQRERLIDLLPLLPDPAAAQARALIELMGQVATGAEAVVAGAALTGAGVEPLVAVAQAATGGTTGSSGGSVASGGSGGTGSGTGGVGGTVDGVVGAVGTAVGGVVGSLTGSGSTSGGTTSGGTTTDPLPLPLPSVSVPPLLPPPSPSPTPTTTTSSGGVLPSLPLATPSGSLCVPLPPITTC